eukprot:scaffold179673_cov19-Prasinocladus_malaysianus.AAC.1
MMAYPELMPEFGKSGCYSMGLYNILARFLAKLAVKINHFLFHGFIQSQTTVNISHYYRSQHTL